MRLLTLDTHLLNQPASNTLTGISRFAIEFLYFGIKKARACLFVGFFFAAIFTMPREGVFGIPRYDLLLIVALAIQVWMVWRKLETFDELKAICLFHVVGFALRYPASRASRSSSPPAQRRLRWELC